MSKMSMKLAAVAVLCLPALAYAQTKTVVIGGQKADYALTPPPASGVGKDFAGPSTADFADMARKATPSVVILPAIVASPETSK